MNEINMSIDHKLDECNEVRKITTEDLFKVIVDSVNKISINDFIDAWLPKNGKNTHIFKYNNKINKLLVDMNVLMSIVDINDDTYENVMNLIKELSVKYLNIPEDSTCETVQHYLNKAIEKITDGYTYKSKEWLINLFSSKYETYLKDGFVCYEKDGNILFKRKNKVLCITNDLFCDIINEFGFIEKNKPFDRVDVLKKVSKVVSKLVSELWGLQILRVLNFKLSIDFNFDKFKNIDIDLSRLREETLVDNSGSILFQRSLKETIEAYNSVYGLNIPLDKIDDKTNIVTKYKESVSDSVVDEGANNNITFTNSNTTNNININKYETEKYIIENNINGLFYCDKIDDTCFNNIFGDIKLNVKKYVKPYLIKKISSIMSRYNQYKEESRFDTNIIRRILGEHVLYLKDNLHEIEGVCDYLITKDVDKYTYFNVDVMCNKIDKSLDSFFIEKYINTKNDIFNIYSPFYDFLSDDVRFYINESIKIFIHNITDDKDFSKYDGNNFDSKVIKMYAMSIDEYFENLISCSKVIDLICDKLRKTYKFNNSVKLERFHLIKEDMDRISGMNDNGDLFLKDGSKYTPNEVRTYIDWIQGLW